MNGIIASADLALAEGNLPKPVEKYLKIIQSSGYTLLDIMEILFNLYYQDVLELFLIGLQVLLSIRSQCNQQSHL
jgi:hypothetical protein